jgi:hypothetical protein
MTDKMTDFDPYDWMIETSLLLSELSTKHNSFIQEHKQLKRKVVLLEKQLVDIQLQLVAKDF